MSQHYISRKRVEMTLNHQKPDRVPCDLTIEPTIYDALCKALGLKYDPYYHDDWNHAYASVEVLEKLKIDVMHIPLKVTPKEFTMDKITFKDDWGITKTKILNDDGSFMYQLVDNPLANAMSMDDILEYKWPKAEELIDITGLEEKVKYLYNNTEFALTATFGGNIFERAHYLRGMENFLIDLMTEPQIAKGLMQKVMEIQMGVDKIVLDTIGKYLTYMRFNGEDVGTQNGQLISLELYNNEVRPFLQNEWQTAKSLFKKYNPEGKISVHSCGSVMNFIPTFIEMGADILNPIQPNALDMDTEKINELYGESICFHGGVDTQDVLVKGSPEDVELEVKKRISDLGKNGGYICAPAHNIQHGVPVDNILSMYNAIQKYGKY